MYHLFVTYLNVSPVCVAALKMLILLCITVVCWFHHIVLFFMPVMWHWPKCGSILQFWNQLNVKSGIIFASILHPLYIFCSVSQQMFCVCCKTLMSCFQIIAHWLHGQQKNENISKYNCMYLCLKECLPWVFLHSYWDYFYTIFVLKSCTLHLSLLWFLFFSLLFWSTLYLSGIFIFFHFLDVFVFC